jgi:hypothetical protein
MEIRRLGTTSQGVLTELLPVGSLVKVIENAAYAATTTLSPVAAATAADEIVWVLQVPPDNFPRPTPMSMYIQNPMVVTTVSGIIYPTGANLASEIYTDMSNYSRLVPITVVGMAVQLHRGGAYTVSCNLFTTVPTVGASVYPADGGKWAISGTTPIGTVMSVTSSSVTVEMS